MPTPQQEQSSCSLILAAKPGDQPDNVQSAQPSATTVASVVAFTAIQPPLQRYVRPVTIAPIPNRLGRMLKICSSILLSLAKHPRCFKPARPMTLSEPEKKAEEELEPTTCNVAGATITISKGRATGSFHDISPELWAAVIGWHRAVSIAHSAESITYHKWNEALGQYVSMIPYQTTAGGELSVKVDWTDPRNVALLDAYGTEYGEGFLPACSIHTHVDIAAGESGIDAGDELDNPGWHITLGNLVSHDQYSLDFRMRLPKIPRVIKRITASCKYQLSYRHLFNDNVDRDFIFKTPGCADWHDKLDRVTVT